MITWLWGKCLDSRMLALTDRLMLLTSQLILNSKGDGMRLYYSSAKCLHCLQLAAFKPSELVCRERGRRGVLYKNHFIVYVFNIKSLKKSVMKKKKAKYQVTEKKYSSRNLYFYCMYVQLPIIRKFFRDEK